MLIVSCMRVCGIGACLWNKGFGFCGVGRVCWCGVRGVGGVDGEEDGEEGGAQWSGGKEWKRREGKWGRGELGKGEEE